MPDTTILPDGKVLIINSRKTGVAGYGNIPDQVGSSNTDNPAFTPILYDPVAPAGSQFTIAGMPTLDIVRLYHSVLTLLPDGHMMITGSNPNLDVKTQKYPTEYQVEYISPPYMNMIRPIYTGLPATWNYRQTKTLKYTIGTASPDAVCYRALMDLGYSTHGVHMDMRMVKLPATCIGGTVNIAGPPNAAVFPPGPAWLYLVTEGVPSKGQKVLIGTTAKIGGPN